VWAVVHGRAWHPRRGVDAVRLAPATTEDTAIVGFTPSHGVAGSTVTIEGSGFGPDTPLVVFNSTNTFASVLDFSDTVIHVVVPAGATTSYITVEDGNGGDTSLFRFVLDAAVAPPTTAPPASEPRRAC